MNRVQQNALCVAALVDGFMQIVEENGSASAAKLAAAVRKKSAVILNSFAITEPKKLKAMERRIKRFESLALRKNEHTAVEFTSTLLALVEDVAGQISKPEPWNNLHKSLFSLHKHYDRKLHYFDEYAKAATLAGKWQYC